jgi:drug/metabolite transporter (DMT)-like permease
MSVAVRTVLLLLVSACVVSGQALLSVLSRRLEWPLALDNIRALAVTPVFYGCILVYLVGFVLYASLLRFSPLAQVNLTLIALVIFATFAYTYLLGQTLTPLQWLGAVLTGIGILALNYR